MSRDIDVDKEQESKLGFGIYTVVIGGVTKKCYMSKSTYESLTKKNPA